MLVPLAGVKVGHLKEAGVDAVGHFAVVLLQNDAQDFFARALIRHAHLELRAKPGTGANNSSSAHAAFREGSFGAQDVILS